MFVNLHALPAGQHMYTLYLKVEHFIEEVDVVASSRADRNALLLAAHDEIVDLYGDAWSLVGIADQSTGEVIYQKAGE